VVESLKRLNRLGRQLSRISAYAACAMIFLMGWMIVLNVFLRVAFNHPLAFVVEYSGFLFVFIIFMGFGWATRTDSHIAVSVVFERFPRRLQRLASLITTFLSLVVIGFYTYFAFRVLADSIEMKEFSVITYTPLWIPKVFMCLGLIIFLIEVLIRFLYHLVLFIRPNAEMPLESLTEAKSEG
jgi:TRAP-type C4-dicarboxylate transport system permease small subunit